MNESSRLGRVRADLDRLRLDVLLVTHLPNARYLCGFTGSSGVLAISKRQAVLFTDGRYTEQARLEVIGATVRIIRKPALVGAGEWLARRTLRRVGIEAAYLTVAERNRLAKLTGPSKKLVETQSLIEDLRLIKDSGEIARIRAACRVGVDLYRRALNTIRSGISESQIAGELELEARKAGVEQMAFPTIVASGERSALPHGRASAALIPAKGFVVCDFGVILAGYCSDMTRTLHVGRPQTEARRVYEAVSEAQQAALEAVKPGTTVGEVDQAARKLLHKRRLGRYFTHSTGHGVGLEIHEAPRLAAGRKELLRPGMVVTIEPGVYVPGRHGVRIEDTVVVTETGCEILTHCPKNLIEL